MFGLADINEKVFSPVFMRAYNNPGQSLIDRRDNPDDPNLAFNSWVGWFWLKRRAFVLDKKVDLAIELVEAYDPDRVLGGIAAALTIYFTLTITWLALGGDPNYVSGVMSFVLSILAGRPIFVSSFDLRVLLYFHDAGPAHAVIPTVTNSSQFWSD